MNRTVDARAVVKELLSTVSNLEMRELCVQALRRAYASDRADYRVAVAGDLLGHLKGLLAERKGWTTVRDLQKRCPWLPGDVVSLMADARGCLDHGLMRPAIVLLGVSYEVAIEHLVVSLSSLARGLLPATLIEASAAKCITEIEKLVDSLFPGPTMKDDRAAVHAACEFANQLRRRRNDAAHTQPTYGFEDREEVEELVISAGWHLPNLWRVH
jgi:hypothetical protein